MTSSTMSIKSLSIPRDLPFQSPKTGFLPKPHSKLPFPHKFRSFPFNRRIQFPKCQYSNNTSLSVPHHGDDDHRRRQEADQLKETQGAICQFLQEFGISTEYSSSIAFNSPKYAKMLMDSVRDLEDWSSWQNGGGAKEFGDLGFKDKVIYMAKEKGDSGKVAFLECLGLSLSSAMNVARYLSGQSLPLVIDKVKYMKEIFFSDSDDKELIGKHARRMMLHLSISVDEDLQRTLSFFEKIEGRRGGLNMLGSSDASFRYLIESFPRILLLPIDTHLEPMVEFLESIGVPKERAGHIFLLFPPIITSDVKSIKRKILAFKMVGAVEKDFSKMLLKYPWILSTSIHDNYEEIIYFFGMVKVAKPSVDKAIRSWPYLLGCSTSKLNVMVEQFGKLGVRNKFPQVISRSPQLLLRKPREFQQVVSFLEGLGFDLETVGKILGRCPEIFATSIEKTLKKKVEFLICIGISEGQLPRVIKKYPEVLVSDTDRTLLPRIQYLMELGFSKQEIASMVHRFSPLLGYSTDEVLRPKYEFLVKTMEKSIKDIVDYPRYFSYSLKKKIKPRFWVLKGRNIECSLKEMLGKNDVEFVTEFMDPKEMVVPRSSSPSPSPHSQQ